MGRQSAAAGTGYSSPSVTPILGARHQYCVQCLLGWTGTAVRQNRLGTICIASCKQVHAPKFVKLDGEKSLIEAAKTFGPSTRRLVEKWHARRNIEKDLTDALNGDMQLLTVIMSLYESLESAKSKWDADLTVKHMEQRIKEMGHPNENKILKTFKIYFDDPSLIAHYTWKDVPLSHHGPGLQEGLFGR